VGFKLFLLEEEDRRGYSLHLSSSLQSSLLSPGNSDPGSPTGKSKK